jgi:hypothetical protein
MPGNRLGFLLRASTREITTTILTIFFGRTLKKTPLTGPEQSGPVGTQFPKSGYEPKF